MDLNLYIIVAAATQRNGPAAKALALSLRDTDAREAEERAVEIMTWRNLGDLSLILSLEEPKIQVMTTYKILGRSDEISTCDRCGKTNLKATVAIEVDGAEVEFWGRDCAAHAVCGNKKASSVDFVEKCATRAAKVSAWIGHYPMALILNKIQCWGFCCRENADGSITAYAYNDPNKIFFVARPLVT